MPVEEVETFPKNGKKLSLTASAKPAAPAKPVSAAALKSDMELRKWAFEQTNIQNTMEVRFKQAQNLISWVYGQYTPN